MKTLPSLLLLSALTFSTAGCLKTPKINNPLARSAQPTSQPQPYVSTETESASAAAAKVEWVAVRDQPDVFLPKGYDLSSPTSADYGEWVNRGGRQYFIPFKGAGKADYAVIFRSLPGGAAAEPPDSGLVSKIAPKNLLPVRGPSNSKSKKAPVDEIWQTESADS